MATPLVSGSLALLMNKYGDLSPLEYKKMLTDSCIPLDDSKDGQGYGMLNLKLLFNVEDDDSVYESFENDKLGLKSDALETIIMVLVVLFLLDSRI